MLNLSFATHGLSKLYEVVRIFTYIVFNVCYSYSLIKSISDIYIVIEDVFKFNIVTHMASLLTRRKKVVFSTPLLIKQKKVSI